MPPMTGVLDPSAPHDDVGCGRQLARGQKKIELIGPVPEVAGAVLEPHWGYWTQTELSTAFAHKRIGPSPRSWRLKRR
jgi:hypothetical protein